MQKLTTALISCNIYGYQSTIYWNIFRKLQLKKQTQQLSFNNLKFKGFCYTVAVMIPRDNKIHENEGQILTIFHFTLNSIFKKMLLLLSVMWKQTGLHFEKKIQNNNLT